MYTVDIFLNCEIMDFFDVITNRHSIRAFKKKDIEEEKIIKILEAANMAPSAGDLQAYEIILIRDGKQKSAIAKAAGNQDFISEAPVVIVICANQKRSSAKYGKRGSELYCINDASIAASYIELASTALDLGSVWVGAFDDNKVAEIIKAPNYIKPIAIIPIGYPNEEPYMTPRRDLDDIVHEGKF